MDPLAYDGTYWAGKHNGGLYNSLNHGSYIYCYQNPVRLVDPNGKQAIAGALIGLFTEYVSIVGSRMIFEHKGFVDANKAMTWSDAANMGLAFAFGAVSGTAKFAKFMTGSVGKLIMKKLAVAAVENFIRLGIELLVDQKGMTAEDAKTTILETFVEVGLESLIPKFAKINKKFAEKELESFGGSLSKKALDAANTVKNAEKLEKVGEVIVETITKTTAKPVTETIEDKVEEKVKEKVKEKIEVKTKKT